MLMSIAFLFPGQGSPTPGMFDGLPAHPVTDATLNEASSILGRDVRRFVEEAALVSEESVQIALLVVGAAATPTTSRAICTDSSDTSAASSTNRRTSRPSMLLASFNVASVTGCAGSPSNIPGVGEPWPGNKNAMLMSIPPPVQRGVRDGT